jgi:DNA topoisomerase I
MDDEAAELARSAGLYYDFDDGPGHTRRRRGRGFSYLDHSGRVLPDGERARIEALVIPPAWTDVWISPEPDNHIVATGRDDAGRKQYLYHERWREARDEQKYANLNAFATRLVDIRQRVAADLERGELTRERAVAAVVRLLDQTLARVGNERYAAENDTFGLTTLESRHVRRADEHHVLSFDGKNGTAWKVAVNDPATRAVLDECRRRRAPQLFCFDGDEGLVDVTSNHVNDYLADVAGRTATARTFRTWGGTVVAAEALARGADELEAIDVAADALGNTRTVCRTCYVAPAVLEAARDTRLESAWRSSRNGQWRSRAECAVAKIL